MTIRRHKQVLLSVSALLGLWSAGCQVDRVAMQPMASARPAPSASAYPPAFAGASSAPAGVLPARAQEEDSSSVSTPHRVAGAAILEPPVVRSSGLPEEEIGSNPIVTSSWRPLRSREVESIPANNVLEMEGTVVSPMPGGPVLPAG